MNKNITKKTVSKAKNKKTFAIDKLKKKIYFLLKKQKKLSYSYDTYADMIGKDPKTIYRSIKELRKNCPDLIISDPVKRRGSYKNRTIEITLSPLSSFHEEFYKENVQPSLLERSDSNTCIVLSVYKEKRKEKKRQSIIQKLTKLLNITPHQAAYFESFTLKCLEHVLYRMPYYLNLYGSAIRSKYAYCKQIALSWCKKKKVKPVFRHMFEKQTKLGQFVNKVTEPIQTLGANIKSLLELVFDLDTLIELEQTFIRAERLCIETGWVEETNQPEILWEDYEL